MDGLTAQQQEELQNLQRRYLELTTHRNQLIAEVASMRDRIAALVIEYERLPAPKDPKEGARIWSTVRRLETEIPSREQTIRVLGAALHSISRAIAGIWRQYQVTPAPEEPGHPGVQKPWERTVEDPGLWGVRPSPAT